MVMGKTGEKTTLSKLHYDHIQTILDDESQLPQLTERLHLLKGEQYADIIQQKDALLEIKAIEVKIEQIKRKKMDYLLSNGDLLHKFNECEKTAKVIHNTETLKPTSTASTIATAVSVAPTEKKFQYYRSYRSRIDPDYVHHNEDVVNEENYCYECNQFRVSVSDEALLVCSKCGSETTVSIRAEKPSTTDPPAENKMYEYKRFTHFCDWLANIQAKESTVVPDNILDIVKKEVIRERMDTKLSQLTGDDIKRYLKKHKFNKWYDNIPQILYRITKLPPPQMTPDMEHNLKLMFMAIQEPYELFKDNRHNFTSYSYIIYKFCHLLGYTEFLSQLKLHKDEGKIYEHDQIWKKICQYMGGEACGWKFIKTYQPIGKKLEVV
jgi:hypothetical protein